MAIKPNGFHRRAPLPRAPRPAVALLAVLFAQGLLLWVTSALLLRSEVVLAPRAWIRATDSAALLLSVGGVLALGLGALTTLGTLAALLSRIAPATAWLRGLEVLALPFVRRTAQRVAVVSLSASTVVGIAAPAGARAGDPVVRTPYTQTPAVDEPVVRAPEAEPATTTVSSTSPQPTTSPPATHPTDRGAPAPEEDEHVVLPGDHLWGIAEQHLRDRGIEQGHPSKSAVARYWASVIAANQDSIRSGDPNLIFAGEIIILPPLSPR